MLAIVLTVLIIFYVGIPWLAESDSFYRMQDDLPTMRPHLKWGLPLPPRWFAEFYRRLMYLWYRWSMLNLRAFQKKEAS
jgi:hypothetical protein